MTVIFTALLIACFTNAAAQCPDTDQAIVEVKKATSDQSNGEIIFILSVDTEKYQLALRNMTLEQNFYYPNGFSNVPMTNNGYEIKFKALPSGVYHFRIKGEGCPKEGVFIKNIVL